LPVFEFVSNWKFDFVQSLKICLWRECSMRWSPRSRWIG
jgi:hypothetical protein